MAGENVSEVPESHAKVKLNLDRLREIVKRYIDKVIWIQNHYFPVFIEVLPIPECFDSCHLAVSSSTHLPLMTAGRTQIF